MQSNLIQELVAVLDGTLNHLRQTRDERGYQPARESLAMRERHTQEQFAGNWGAEPIEQAHSAAMLLYRGGDDHVEGLCRVVQPDALAYSPMTLARSAWEMHARAWRLLDPGIGLRERVGRGMTERLYSLWEASKFPPEAREEQDPQGQIESLLATADAFGYVRSLGDERRPPWVQEKRPGAAKVIGEAHREALGEVGEATYRFLAAKSHGTLFGLVDPRPYAPPGLNLRPVVAPVFLAMVLALTAVTQIYTVAREVEVYGWDTPEWRGWIQHVLDRSLNAFERARDQAQADLRQT